MKWKAAIAIALIALIAAAPLTSPAPTLVVEEQDPVTDDVVQDGLPGFIGLTAVASGLTNPIGAFNAADGSNRLFIIEQRGTIRVVSGGVLQPGFWMDIQNKALCCGERGLLGLAFHPNFETNKQFFVSYTREGDGASVLERYTVDAAGNPIMSSGTIFLVQSQPFANHNGGNIMFGPDGFLYFGFGDGGSGGDPQGNGQNPNTMLGKMIRIDINTPDPARGKLYSIPNGNPFKAGGGAPEAYMLGLRNPWRWSFDRATGDLWIADVGQNLVEEVNYVPAGAGAGWNFGWNRWEAHNMYTFPSLPTGFIFPVMEYAHFPHCSVTGGYVYRGPSVSLQGKYLFGDYCSGVVWAGVGQGFPAAVGVAIGHTGAFVAVPLMASLKAITSFGEGEDGNVYLVHYGGTVYRIDAP